MTKVGDHVADSLRTVRIVLGNRGLLRLLAALALSGISGWAYFVALQIFAYDSGGEAAVGLVTVLAMVPAGVIAPFAAVVADRYPRERVLVASSLFRVCVLAAAAAVIYFEGPAPVVYALAVAGSIAARVFFPAQAALLPSLATKPDELTAANSLATAIQNGALLVGPALGGALVALTSAGTTVGLAAGILLVGTLALVGLQARPAPTAPAGRISLSDVLAGLRAIAGRPALRRPVALYGTVMLADGVLGVLIVVLALSVLDIGEGGLGLLNGALGAGALVGALLGLVLARIGQGRALAASAVAWGASLVLVAAWPRAGVALFALVVVGAAMTVIDIACVTVLQRVAAEDVRGRVFGVLEGVLVVAIGIGAALAPSLEDLLGTRGLLLATGVASSVVGVVLAVRVTDAIDEEHERRARLLRAYPPAARLAPGVFEGVVAALVPVSASAGDVIVREGGPGDRFYLVASGEMEVVEGKRRAADLTVDGWFGELALLSDTSRTATVAAVSDAELYALDRETFLRDLAGFAAAPAAEVRPAA